MANPFQIDVGNPLQGLGQMAQAYGQKTQQEEQAAAQAAKQQEVTDLLGRADVNEISQYMAANPQLAKGIEGAFQFKDTQTKQNMADSSIRIMQGEDPYEVIRDRAAYVSQQGGDPSQTLAALELSPEQLQKEAKFMFAMNATPEQRKAIGELGTAQGMGKNVPSDIRVAKWYETATEAEKDAFNQTKRGSKKPIEQQIADAEKLASIEIRQEMTGAERKQGVSDLSGIAKGVNQSNKQINTIRRMEQLNEKAFSGAGADIGLALAKAANQIGIDVEGISESEQFAAIGNSLVLDKSQEMSGALSNGDMEFLKNTTPTLSNTKEGRAKMLDYSVKLQEREKERAKQAQRFRKNKGYFSLSEFEDKFQLWADANPLFTSEDQPEEVLTTDMSDQDLARSLGL